MSAIGLADLLDDLKVVMMVEESTDMKVFLKAYLLVVEWDLRLVDSMAEMKVDGVVSGTVKSKVFALAVWKVIWSA